jgi:predicted RNase H-like HicB family nuclease
MMDLALKEDRTDAIEHSVDSSERQPEPVYDRRVQEAILERESLPHLPMQLIEKYADIAARHATLKWYPDGWFAKIPGFQGVWAQERTEEKTLEVLKEVVADWTLLKIEHHDKDLPVLEEIDLNVL